MIRLSKFQTDLYEKSPNGNNKSQCTFLSKTTLLVNKLILLSIFKKDDNQNHEFEPLIGSRPINIVPFNLAIELAAQLSFVFQVAMAMLKNWRTYWLKIARFKLYISNESVMLSTGDNHKKHSN